MAYDYDLFVIGGGSGGVRAARVAADEAGRRVGIAEERAFGGTCVLRGCVPKKLMVFASEYGALFSEAADYGWDVAEGEPTFHWDRFRPRLQSELGRLEQIYRGMLERSGVTIHHARAEVEDAHTVRLSTGERVTAEHILIATGGYPTKPDLPGAEHGIVSDDMFGLEELPRRLLVVGGGYIACEFACMMRGMGVDVTIYHRSAQILRGFDGEARGLIAEGMRANDIEIHLGTSILEMDRREDGTIWTKSTAGIERECDAVLFATGRGASTKGLGLEEAGVEMHGNGAVKVDRFSRSNVPSIWAIGDVTDRIQLTPVAIREAMAFVRTVFEGRPTPADHELVASAVFTHPEMGAVGMTEEEAAERHEIEVYATSFRPMRTAFIDRPSRVLMKLIVEAGSRRVLGCHVVSPQAAEVIQLAGVAVKMGATKEDFDRTCAVHPTMSEEMVTMRKPVRTSSPATRDEGRMRTA